MANLFFLTGSPSGLRGRVAKKKADLLQVRKRTKERLTWQSSPPSHGVMREAEILLVCVRWSVRDALRSRDLEALMQERGRSVDHTTISRWVQHSAPEWEKRCRPHLTTTNASWRVDETEVSSKGVWMDLSCAVDSQGKTLEFL